MNINPPKSNRAGTQFCFMVTGCGPKLEVQLKGVPGAKYTVRNGPKPGTKEVCVLTPTGSRGFLNIRVGSGGVMDRGAVLIYP